MTATNSETTGTMADTTMECAVQTIVGFMLPFFLAGAGGNPDIAKAAIRGWIGAFNARNINELDLVARLVTFGVTAMDNLRLSAAPDLSDTKILRYRTNAATLSRASDQARKILETLQANQKPIHATPRPSIAPALPVAPPVKTPRATVAANAAPALPRAAAMPVPPLHAGPLANSLAAAFPEFDVEAMKRDARIRMQTFSKRGLEGAAHIPAVGDPAALAAAKAAFAAMHQFPAR